MQLRSKRKIEESVSARTRSSQTRTDTDNGLTTKKKNPLVLNNGPQTPSRSNNKKKVKTHDNVEDNNRYNKLKITGIPQKQENTTATRDGLIDDCDLNVEKEGLSKNLFSLLFNKKPIEEIYSVVNQWAELNKTSPQDSYIKLLKFLVLCSGIKLQVPNNIFSSKAALEKFCSLLPNATQNKQVLNLSFSGSWVLDKTDFKNICQVFSKCFTHIKPRIVSFETKEYKLLYQFINTLCTLTSSNLRSIRRVSTVACIQLVNNISYCYSQFLNKAELLTSKKISSNNKSITSAIDKIDQSKNVYYGLIQLILESLYPKRFRDCDPAIRTACASFFGTWAHNAPRIFLKKEYLDHIKWFFFDKSPNARSACIDSLIKVYVAGQNIPFIQTYFSDNVKKRLLDVILNNTDFNTRIKTCEILSKMAADDLLNTKEIESIFLFAYDSNPGIRKKISSLLVSYWQKKELNYAHSKIKHLLPNMSTTQKNNIELLSFADFIIKLSKLKNLSSASKTSTSIPDTSLDYEPLDVTYKRDISDYVEFFSHMYTIPAPEDFTYLQVSTIVNATKKNIPVLSIPSLLDLVDLCLSSNTSTRELIINPSEDQEICILYIFYTLCETANSETKEDIDGDSGRNAPENRLYLLAPKIINKYAFNVGVSKVNKVCEQLLIVLRKLKFENLSAVESNVAFTPLIECVVDFLKKTTSLEVVREVAFFFEYIMAPIIAQSANHLDYIFSNAVITHGPPASYTMANVASTARESFENVLKYFIDSSISSLSSLISLPLDTEKQIEDTLNGLYLNLFKISRLICITGYRNVNGAKYGEYDFEKLVQKYSEKVFTKNEKFENLGYLFDSIRYILDHLLMLMLPGFNSKSKYLLTNASIQCIEILCLDSVWELWEALSEAVRKACTSKTINRIDNKSYDSLFESNKVAMLENLPNIKDRIALIRSSVSLESLEMLPKAFINKSQEIIKIVEAIVVGFECNIPLDLPFRVSSYERLSNLLMFISGDSSLLFPNISYLPPKDFQDKTKVLLSRMLNALAFSKPHLNETIISKSRSRSSRKAPQLNIPNSQCFSLSEARHYILKIVADFERLISYGILDMSLSDILFGYYGISTVTSSILPNSTTGRFNENLSLINPFDAAWDGIVEHCASRIFGARFNSLALGLINLSGNVSALNNHPAALEFSNYLSNSLDILLTSFMHSLELYRRKLYYPELPLVKLSKLICKTIYSWSSFAASKPNFEDLRLITYKSVTAFVIKCSDLILVLTKDHVTPNDQYVDLTAYNKVWKSWKLVICAYSHIKNVLKNASLSGQKSDNDNLNSEYKSDGSTIYKSLCKKLISELNVPETDLNSQVWMYFKSLEKCNNSSTLN